MRASILHQARPPFWVACKHKLPPVEEGYDARLRQSEEGRPGAGQSVQQAVQEPASVVDWERVLTSLVMAAPSDGRSSSS